jgi:RNA polymerase sigma factor (TIGR02999 family)
MSDVTSLLNALQGCAAHAADQLLPLVYDELRRLAAQKLAHEKPGQTLDATALVHEAYLRLLRGGEESAPCEPRYANHKHFFLAAAEAMRRILIENARRKKRLRHGGDRQRLDVESLDPPAPDAVSDRLLAVDEALERLALEEPQVAEVVRLRWFAGLTIEQTAAALSIAVRSANRHWAYARAWLFQQLNECEGDAGK